MISFHLLTVLFPFVKLTFWFESVSNLNRVRLHCYVSASANPSHRWDHSQCNEILTPDSYYNKFWSFPLKYACFSLTEQSLNVIQSLVSQKERNAEFSGQCITPEHCSIFEQEGILAILGLGNAWLRYRPCCFEFKSLALIKRYNFFPNHIFQYFELFKSRCWSIQF